MKNVMILKSLILLIIKKNRNIAFWGREQKSPIILSFPKFIYLSDKQ